MALKCDFIRFIRLIYMQLSSASSEMLAPTRTDSYMLTS